MAKFDRKHLSLTAPQLEALAMASIISMDEACAYLGVKRVEPLLQESQWLSMIQGLEAGRAQAACRRPGPALRANRLAQGAELLWEVVLRKIECAIFPNRRF